jgi:hypothetical protein
MNEEKDDFNIDLIENFEELEYDLSGIGLQNLYLVFEYDIIYLYNNINDFYYELNLQIIDDILIRNNTITIRDDEYCIIFNEDQTDLIKNIFKDVLDAEYRNRLASNVQE